MIKLILLLGVSLYSCEIIMGKISLRGNEPFTSLQIETKNKTYNIIKKSPVYGDIYKKQNKTLILKGEITRELKQPANSEFKANKILDKSIDIKKGWNLKGAICNIYSSVILQNENDFILFYVDNNYKRITQKTNFRLKEGIGFWVYKYSIL